MRKVGEVEVGRVGNFAVRRVEEIEVGGLGRFR